MVGRSASDWRLRGGYAIEDCRMQCTLVGSALYERLEYRRLSRRRLSNRRRARGGLKRKRCSWRVQSEKSRLTGPYSDRRWVYPSLSPPPPKKKPAHDELG